MNHMLNFIFKIMFCIRIHKLNHVIIMNSNYTTRDYFVKKLLTSLLFLSTFTTYAMADSITIPVEINPIYLEGSVGYATIHDWNNGSAAFTLNAGYNFNSNFALEAGYTYIMPQTNYILSINYIANQSWADIAAKGSIRISPIASFYVKGGVAAGFSSSSLPVPTISYATGTQETNIAILSGIGITLSPWESLKFKAETYGIIPLSSTAFGNVSVFSIGAQYSF